MVDVEVSWCARRNQKDASDLGVEFPSEWQERLGRILMIRNQLTTKVRLHSRKPPVTVSASWPNRPVQSVATHSIRAITCSNTCAKRIISKSRMSNHATSFSHTFALPDSRRIHPRHRDPVSLFVLPNFSNFRLHHHHDLPHRRIFRLTQTFPLSLLLAFRLLSPSFSPPSPLQLIFPSQLMQSGYGSRLRSPSPYIS